MRTIVFLLIFFLLTHQSYAGYTDSLPPTVRRLNIVLSNKSAHPDPAMMSLHTQAWWNQIWHRKKLRFIIASTIEEAITRISNIMEKEHAMIGNIWFDSHGHMGRRVSILEIGDVELNYQTLKEPWIKDKVKAIGKYCDSLTIVSIGSCYSAASYYSAGIDSFPPHRMNGDSLMSQMADAMNHATIYGSVSWITTKPGLFRSGYAFAGNPWAKRFKDPKFRSAWDSLGVWKSYTAKQGFNYINTVTMDHSANILVKDKSFLDIPKNKKKQQKIIKRLKAGNFDDKYFYKYKDPLQTKKGKK
ncbi:MAG TPA: hypothetical protein VK166_13420 [Chitinophagaceae bacterium]|nr:hypothetical protein [Chitinophagaceae bacterium]